MIKVICVGKLKEKYLVDGVNDYLKRISKYHKINIIELNDSNINSEGNDILKYIDKGFHEVYNKMTGVLRTFSIRSYEQIESLLIKLLNTPEGKDFFDEKTTLAKITKGLTTPHSVNEKLEM